MNYAVSCFYFATKCFKIPYQLHKAQLAILHCGNTYDNTMIENVWESILDAELKTGDDNGERIIAMLKELHALYGKTNYFPNSGRLTVL